MPLWLGSLFSKTTLYILAALLITGSIAYSVWKISDLATNYQKMKDQVVELKGVVEQQQTVIKQTQDLMKLSNDAVQALTDSNAKISEDLGKVNDFLTSPEARKDDRPASNVLKQTIQRLHR